MIDYAQPGSLDQYLDLINERDGLGLLIVRMAQDISKAIAQGNEAGKDPVVIAQSVANIRIRIDMAARKQTEIRSKLLDYSVGLPFFADDEDVFYAWFGSANKGAYNEYRKYKDWLYNQVCQQT